MNEQQTFERTVAESVSSVGPLAPSDGVVDQIITRVDRKRQRPEWLALIKEPPMRSNSRTAVGSPTVRVVAIMAATLLLAMLVAGAGMAGQHLLAADDTIVVAQDGSGDYTTISEAVAAAADGNEILVKPDTYAESIEIDKDIKLRGEDRDGVIIEAPEEGPESPFKGRRYALLLTDSAAEVSDLTLRGEFSLLHVDGGAPILVASPCSWT
jgi:hypothetical protein